MARRLLVIFGASIVIVVSLGAITEAILTRIDAYRYPPPGRLVDIGGARLHVRCLGTGDPTVVIDAGAGSWSVSWMAIQQQLAEDGRVCTFDRAGLGWSDPSPRPRTSAVMSEELHTLLHRAGLTPPFVLVGHSLGGYNARLFADRYRSEVAALVLVESAHEHQWERLPAEVTAFAMRGARQLLLASVLARVGLLRLVTIPDPHVARVASALQPAFRAALMDAKVYDTWRAETRAAFESAREVARSGPLGDFPLVVVSAGRSFDAFKTAGADIPFDQANATWMQLQRDLVRLSPNGVQLISPAATHDINFDDPAIIIAAIRSARIRSTRAAAARVRT